MREWAPGSSICPENISKIVCVFAYTGRGSSVSNSFPKALRLRSTLKELIPRRLDTRKLTYQDIHSGTWTGVEDAY